MKSIYIIRPVVNPKFEKLILRKAQASSHAQLHVVSIDKGPVSIECRYDEAVAIPYILKKVKEIKDKADAIVINCFCDPGVDAAREITNVPIIGPGASAMALAQLLGHNFSVVTVLSRLAPIFKELASKLGITKLISVRAVNIPVLELGNSGKTIEKLVEESVKAIELDGAHVIVLGCTGMLGLAEQLKHELTKQGYSIPVLDPLIISLKLAESLVDMKTSQSRLTYPMPPEKERTGGEHI